MNSKIIIAALLIVGTIPLAASPFASAKHTSVGAEDSVGVQPVEEEGQPSVPTDSELWTEGLRNVSTCQSWTGTQENLTGEAQATLSAHPFCGRLQYNADVDGAEEFIAPSPADQDYPGDNPYQLELDGTLTYTVGVFGIGYCMPFWCLPATAQPFQDTGAAAGITDDYEGYKAGAGSETESQRYKANIDLPNSADVAASALGTYEGNGWLLVGGPMSITAFLESPVQDIDGDGQADLDADGRVNQSELDRIVAHAKSTDSGFGLSADAVSAVCAFTPEDEISIGAAQLGFCEVPLQYKEEADVTGGGNFDGYSNACESPTYICGANQEGWYAALWFTPHPGDGIIFADAEQDSTTDYDVWHYVVAPSEPTCSSQEPGFKIQGGSGPLYLGHDLDIYEPAGDAVDVNQAANVRSFYHATSDNTEDIVAGTADEVLDLIKHSTFGPAHPVVSNATDATNQTIDTVINATYITLKDRTVEPNAAGDSSQSIAGAQADTDDPLLVRTLDEPGVCEPFQSGNEQVADPWVDYMDTWVWQDLVCCGLIPLHADPGASTHQDASNTGETGFYYSSGYLGMMTDRDDNGEYDQADSNDQWTDWQQNGHYPMYWDMRVEQTGPNTFEAGDGCKPAFGQTGVATQMTEAGYGIHTGLIQVVYLGEPTVLRHDSQNIQQEYVAGDNAYVFLSQSMRTLLEGGDSVAKATVQRTLDKLPDALGSFSLDSTDPSADTDRIKFPGKGQVESDFGDQCGGDAGDYGMGWTWSHTCATGCGGDTIATSYVFEVTNSDGSLGGGGAFKTFTDVNGDPYDFTRDPSYDSNLLVNQWFDVDPFTGEADDNNQESSAPPTE